MFWKLFMLLSVVLSGSQGNLTDLNDAIIRGDISTVCREIERDTPFNKDTLSLAKTKCRDSGICKMVRTHDPYKANRRCGIYWALEDASRGNDYAAKEVCRSYIDRS